MTNVVLELDIHYYDLRTMNDHGPDRFLISIPNYFYGQKTFFLNVFIF